MCDADASRAAGWPLVDLAAACLDGGATFLQLRAKHEPAAAFLAIARQVVALAARASAAHGRPVLIVVNDRADIARLAGAGGVHVGQEDLAPVDVGAVLGSSSGTGVAGGVMTVGLSTHTAAQIDAGLREPVDYLAIGPVFGTATKATGYEPVGMDGVRAAAARIAGRRPLVAIGGITLDRAPDVLAAGASAVAVIGDLLATGDPAARVQAFLDRLAR